MNGSSRDEMDISVLVIGTSLSTLSEGDSKPELARFFCTPNCFDRPDHTFKEGCFLEHFKELRDRSRLEEEMGCVLSFPAEPRGAEDGLDRKECWGCFDRFARYESSGEALAQKGPL